MTEQDKDTRSYRQQCQDYALGFAAGIFMCTTALAFIPIYSSLFPDFLVSTTTVFFPVFAIIGFVVLGIAYTRPVDFYELLEESGD